MLFGSKKNSVSVTQNADYVIWDIDISGVAYDTTLNVEAGCFGLYIVNGQLRSNNPAGRWLINPKSEKRDQNKLQLLGVTADKTFVIPCGVGEVPYKDWDLGTETKVGMRGSAKVRILNAWTLYNTLGKSNIKSIDIDNYVHSKIAELMTTQLAKVLEKYDYLTITTQQSEVSNVLFEKFREELGKVGLQMEEFSLEGFHFKDEYVKSRNEALQKDKEKKEDKQKRREEERRQQAEIDMIKDLASISNQPKKEVEAPRTTYCPKCGQKLDGNAVFCPNCGKKI